VSKSDILLRLKTGGIPRHRTAELGVSGLRDCQARTPLESVCRRSTGSLLGVPSPRDFYSLSCLDSQSCFCLQEVGQTSTDLELLCYHSVSPGACCLIPAWGHAVSSVGGHSNRQLVSARRHWGRNQCADIHLERIVDQERSEIRSVTARIHGLKAVVLRLFQIIPTRYSRREVKKTITRTHRGTSDNIITGVSVLTHPALKMKPAMMVNFPLDASFVTSVVGIES
jgi:hypothetical protein